MTVAALTQLQITRTQNGWMIHQPFTGNDGGR